MADTLESLEIEVKHSASGAADEITKVAQAISGLGRALSAPLVKKLTGLADAMKQIGEAGSPINLNHYTGNTFQKITQSASKAAKAAESSPLSEELREQISQAGKLEIAVHKAAKAGKDMQDAFDKGNENAAWSAREREINAAEKAAREIEKATPKPEVENPVELPTALPQSMQDFISSASQIDLLQAKLVSLNAAMQEAFNVGDSDKAISLRNQILQTEAALEKAEKAANGAANGVKNLAKEAKKSQSPLAGFISSLKRIAFYRMIRSIIKTITEALQEGLQYAYEFSAGIDGEGHRFAEAMDSMKTSATTMKAQLGSAFISLLAGIMPIIMQLISMVTKAADAIAQLFAALTGTTYLKAVDSPQKWADEAGGAAKAAKEWKNQLLGFDEINRLNEPNQGGGGGASGIDPSSLFQESPIADWAMELSQKIVPIIDGIKLAFEGLDEFITGVFTNDWEMAFGGLAKIVEGLGKAVSGLVDFVLNLADGFLQGIESLGDSLFTYIEEKTGLNLASLRRTWHETFANIRSFVAAIGGDIKTILGGLVDFIAGVLTGDWERAWEGLKDILLGVLRSALHGSLNTINLVVDALNWLLSYVNSKLPWLYH